MTIVNDAFVIYGVETSSILAAKNAPRGKNASAGKGNGAMSKTQDVVSLSQAARENYAALAAANGEEGNTAALVNVNAVQYKNETKAIKAALQQIAEETGVPMQGWAVGHYRQAFAAGDFDAMRSIYLARHGITKTPAAPGTDGAPSIPVEVEPEKDLEPGNNLESENDGEAGTDDESDLIVDVDDDTSSVIGDDVDEDATLTVGFNPGYVPDLEELLDSIPVIGDDIDARLKASLEIGRTLGSAQTE